MRCRISPIDGTTYSVKGNDLRERGMRLQRLVHDLHPSEPQAKMRPPQLEPARTKAPSLGPVNSVEPPAPIWYWDENKDGTASTRLVVVMSEDWQEEERGGLSDHGCTPVGCWRGN